MQISLPDYHEFGKNQHIHAGLLKMKTIFK